MTCEVQTKDAKALLRHFSVTDGLIRGTGLLSMVVFNAAIALLPGFGLHGLVISNALQDFINGIFEIPLGWLSDRFGWSKAVSLSMGLKILVPVVDLLAVYSAWLGAHEAIWIFIGLDSLIDAFVFSLQNGAYQAAYTEWYQHQLTKRGWKNTEAAPPLFIKSLRYSMRIRLFVPLTVLIAILAIQLGPWNSTGLTAYTATFLSFAVILVLRVIVFLRVVSDLKELHAVEKKRIERHTTISWRETFQEVLGNIASHKPAFVLYALACFQTILSGGLITGLGMRQLNQLSWPEPYGWLAGVGLALAVYIVDAVFWLFFGHRINKSNAAGWIRNLGIALLNSCVVTATLHLIEAHHLLQGLCFGGCVLLGSITAGAITRFVSSHLREWLKSDLLATWMSAANCVSLLAIATLGWMVIQLDEFIPIVLSLLIVSVLIAIAIIYYLSHGILETRREAISLRSMLAHSSLSVAILAGVIVGALTLFFTVTRLVFFERASEKAYLARVSHASLKLGKETGFDPFSGMRSANVCLVEGAKVLKTLWAPCGTRAFLAASDRNISIQVDGVAYLATLRFDRGKLFSQVVQYFLFAAVIFLVAVILFYQLLTALTRRVHHELETILDYSLTPPTDRDPQSLNQFMVLEFKEITEKLEALNALRNELTKHRTVADISARVAHDIRSPLTVFKILSQSFEALPEASRSLLHGAIQRMCEISSELLQAEHNVRGSDLVGMNSRGLSLETLRTQKGQVGDTILGNFTQETNLDRRHLPKSELLAATSCFLPQLLPEVLKEKRLVADSQGDISIELFYDCSAYASFVLANPIVLKSVIANLLQNSIEAIGGEGQIEVLVKASGEKVLIEVADDGMGIPEEVLPSLLKQKASFGKLDGNGLGLFSAKQSLESWGGNIAIESKEGVGTNVLVELCQSSSPSWFLKEVTLSLHRQLWVVEPDPKVRQMWQRKLEFFKPQFTSKNVQYFSKCEEVVSCEMSLSGETCGILFLPYHQEFKTTPLEFIEKLRTQLKQFQVVLVSEELDDEIPKTCEELGLKWIPKPLVSAVPLRFSPENKEPSALTCDEDPTLLR